MMYNFDEMIDRRHTNCMSTDGFRSYIFKDNEGTMTFPYKDDEFIRMWIADMEFATPDFILEAMKMRIDRRIFGYSKVFDPAYYEAFRQWCDRMYDWHCEREEMVTSPGIVPALYWLVGFLTKPDEKILIMTPSYKHFSGAPHWHNRELLCSDLVNDGTNYFTIDFKDFEEKAADPKTTLCIFCNPHNPTGRIWTEDELKRVGEICRKHNVYIISDEIHCDLIRTGRKHIPLAKALPDYKNIITCMSPSKTFNMAGTMLSNLVIPNPETRALWLEKRYMNDNPISIAGVQAAYAEGADWLAQLKVYIDKNFEFVKEFIETKLPKAVFRIPEATYLGWVDVGAYLGDVESLPKFFADNAGVLLEGGNMFVQNSDGFIRLNVACQRKVLEEGMNRIANAILAHQK